MRTAGYRIEWRRRGWVVTLGRREVVPGKGHGHDTFATRDMAEAARVALRLANQAQAIADREARNQPLPDWVAGAGAGVYRG